MLENCDLPCLRMVRSGIPARSIHTSCITFLRTPFPPFLGTDQVTGPTLPLQVSQKPGKGSEGDLEVIKSRPDPFLEGQF